MAEEKLCVAKNEDGSACPRKARPYSNYCEKHQPGIESSSHRSGGLSDFVNYTIDPTKFR